MDKKQRSFSEPIQKENMSSKYDILKKDKYSSKFELSTKQREEIQEAFSTLDRGTGLIDSNKDLKIALRSLGFEPKKNEIKKLMVDVDKANKDKLDFKDFVEIMSAKLAEKDTKEEIHKAFHLFDRDLKGHITFENLKLIAGELGEVLTDEEIQEMINEADMDGDGGVNQEEFFRIMKKTSLY